MEDLDDYGLEESYHTLTKKPNLATAQIEDLLRESQEEFPSKNGKKVNGLLRALLCCAGVQTQEESRRDVVDLRHLESEDQDDWIQQNPQCKARKSVRTMVQDLDERMPKAKKCPRNKH